MACMKCVTNFAAGLVKRAAEEQKSIVFTQVCVTQDSERTSRSVLIGKPEAWYGANSGTVSACISHFSLNGVQCVCNARLGIAISDNRKPWKTLSIWGKIEGDTYDGLLYAESDDNGSYNNALVVELPISLDGAVEDFGTIEDGTVEYATKAYVDGTFLSDASYDSTTHTLTLTSPDETRTVEVVLA